MSGLIAAGMMKGLGDGASSLGTFMMQDQSRRDSMAQRDEDRRQLQAERLAATTASRSGGRSEPFINTMEEGSMEEERTANKMGISIPELRQIRAANKTGDTSSFAKDVPVVADERAADPYQPEARQATTKQLPPNFDKWLEEKRRQLGNAQDENAFGDKYDDVVKGRRGQQEIDASKAAMATPDKAGIIGQGMAAGTGKPLQANGVNAFTGEANDVGESVVEKNEGLANKANRPPVAKGGGDPEEGKNARAVQGAAKKELSDAQAALAKLRQVQPIGKSAKEEHAANIAAANSRVSQAQADLKSANARLAQRGSAGDNSNVKSPAAGGQPQGKSFSSLWK